MKIPMKREENVQMNRGEPDAKGIQAQTDT